MHAGARTRTDRNGARHRRVDDRPQAVYPLFSLDAAPASVPNSAARHIGRIGALAVALGVGVAVATGHGAGVARADDGSEPSASGTSSESTSNESTAGAAGSTSTSATDTTTTVPSGSPGTSDGGGHSPDSGPTVPEMNVSSSGGAHTSGSATGGATEVDDEDEADLPAVVEVDPSPSSTPAANPLPRQNDSLPAPQPAAPPRPAAASDPTPAGTVVRDREAAQSHDIGTVTPTSNTTGTAVTQSADPEPAVPEPAPPAAAATMLAAAIAPFLLPGTGGPAASPLLWAVLAWTRRESDEAGAEPTAAVTPFNVAPVSNIQNVDMDENTSHVGTLPAATDADGDPFTYSVREKPVNGTVTVDPGGSYAYTPTPGFYGRDSFVFSVIDHLGGRADYTVFFTVRMVNNPPVASNTTISVAENGSYTGSLPAATDADGEKITYSAAHGLGPSKGTVTVAATGSFTYTPEPGRSGTDSFSYDVTDGVSTSTYTVSVTIAPINHEPTAVDGIITTQHGVPVSFGDSFNDPDGDPLTFRLDAPSTVGTFTQNPDGTVTYTPRAGFVGEATVAYTVTDPSGLAAGATITVVVKNGPVVTRDDVYIGDDGVYTGNVLDNDVDSDREPIAIVSHTLPSSGALVLAPDGSFTYTPEPGVSGTFEFTYTVSDGADYATATVRFIVAAEGKPPVAAPDSATVEAGETVVIDVLGNDVDPNGTGLWVSSVDEPVSGQVRVTESGTIQYTADPDFTGVTAFTYTVSNGWADQTVTVTVTVLPSTAPVTVDDEVTIRAGEVAVIDALANDSIPKGATVVITSQPQVGTVRFDDATGTFVYTPGEESYAGGFGYEVTDGLGRTSYSWVTITVDQAPYPNDDSTSTPIDEAVVIDVLSNDWDDEDGPLTVTITTKPDAGGTAVVQKDGTILFTPDKGFQGYVTFGYTVTDGAGNTATATVGINVYDPTTVELDKAYTVGKDRTIAVPRGLGLLSNTVYAEYGKARLFRQPSHGTVHINLDGSFTYTPHQGFVGEDTFEFALDGGEFGDGATATILVTPDGPGTEASYGVALALAGSDSAYGTCGENWYPGLGGPENQWPTCLFVADSRPEDLL